MTQETIDAVLEEQELQDERKKLLAEMARIDQLHKTLGNVAIPGEPLFSAVHGHRPLAENTVYAEKDLKVFFRSR